MVPWRQGTVSSCERQSFLLRSHKLELSALAAARFPITDLSVQLIPGWPRPSLLKPHHWVALGLGQSQLERRLDQKSAEQSYRWLYRQHIRPLCMHRSHLLQHSSSGTKILGWQRENHPLRRKRAGAQLSGLLFQQLGIRFCPWWVYDSY